MRFTWIQLNPNLTPPPPPVPCDLALFRQVSGVGVQVLCREAFLGARGSLRVHRGLGGPPTVGSVREDPHSFSGAAVLKGHAPGPKQRNVFPRGLEARV